MKHDQNGNRYDRPPNIEVRTDEALNQNLDTLCHRAALDNRAPGYLPSECLLHLIREAGRRGDYDTMNALLPFLLTRCEAILFVKIPDDGFQNAADLREEVLGEFAELLASDGCPDSSNELDFYECRFNLAFRAFRINYIRREVARVKHEDLPNLSDDSELTAYDDIFPRISGALRSADTPESDCSLQDLLKEINNLPTDEREAVILCHVMGFKVESEDPEETTAATLCDVTGRTIRNRLSRAAKMLLKYKEEA